MARAKKFSESKVILKVMDNNSIILDVVDEGTGEIIDSKNLGDEINSLKSLVISKNGEPKTFSVEIKEFKEKVPSNKKKQNKYVCRGCRTIIKSAEDELNLICGNCKEKFEIEE